MTGKQVGLERFQEDHSQKGDTDDEWIKNVRSEFLKGNLEGKSNLHKQLKFYMTLAEISKCEQNIVKTLLERIRIHSDWEAEKNID